MYFSLKTKSERQALPGDEERLTAASASKYRNFGERNIRGWTIILFKKKSGGIDFSANNPNCLFCCGAPILFSKPIYSSPFFFQYFNIAHVNFCKIREVLLLRDVFPEILGYIGEGQPLAKHDNGECCHLIRSCVSF